VYDRFEKFLVGDSVGIQCVTYGRGVQYEYIARARHAHHLSRHHRAGDARVPTKMVASGAALMCAGRFEQVARRGRQAQRDIPRREGASDPGRYNATRAGRDSAARWRKMLSHLPFRRRASSRFSKPLHTAACGRTLARLRGLRRFTTSRSRTVAFFFPATASHSSACCNASPCEEAPQRAKRSASHRWPTS
jgi:hypothetical protein